MYLSIIVHYYNEETVIAETHRRITDVMKDLDNFYEIIFVNDGSRDNTLNLLKSFAITEFNIKVLDSSRNFGHQPSRGGK